MCVMFCSLENVIVLCCRPLLTSNSVDKSLSSLQVQFQIQQPVMTWCPCHCHTQQLWGYIHLLCSFCAVALCSASAVTSCCSALSNMNCPHTGVSIGLTAMVEITTEMTNSTLRFNTVHVKKKKKRRRKKKTSCIEEHSAYTHTHTSKAHFSKMQLRTQQGKLKLPYGNCMLHQHSISNTHEYEGCVLARPTRKIVFRTSVALHSLSRAEDAMLQSHLISIITPHTPCSPRLKLFKVATG